MTDVDLPHVVAKQSGEGEEWQQRRTCASIFVHLLKVRVISNPHGNGIVGCLAGRPHERCPALQVWLIGDAGASDEHLCVRRRAL